MKDVPQEVSTENRTANAPTWEVWEAWLAIYLKIERSSPKLTVNQSGKQLELKLEWSFRRQIGY